MENFVEFCESDLGEEIMDREAAFIDEKLSGKSRILNVGCGIGSVEERLDMDIVGLDSSMLMLEEAKGRSDKLFVHGNSGELPFPDNSFEAVLSVTTMEFLDDFERAIDESRRVLKNGGKMLLLVLNPLSTYFRNHMEKDESYFHGFRNEPSEIESYVERYFDISSEYFLGIEDEKVFDSDDKSSAAIYVIEGVLGR